MSHKLGELLERQGYATSQLDLGKASRGDIESFIRDELSRASLLVVGSPAYAHHALFPVVTFMGMLPDVPGTPALVFSTYGGVSKGVTLVQLAEALQCKGYRVKGAAKVLCVHSLFFRAKRPPAEGHPDESDWELLEEWIGAVAGRLETEERYTLDPASLRPASPVLRFMDASFFNMRLFSLMFPRFRFCSVRCRRCGTCQDRCPTGRLDILPPPRAGKDCLYCLECVRVCPGAAFDAPMWLIQPFILVMKHLVNRWEDPVTEYYL